jgi:hypothetical protein
MFPENGSNSMAVQLTIAERPCRFRRCLSFRGSIRSLPELPESPEPLVPLAKELVMAKRARRGRKCTRMPVVGGANLRPDRPSGTAWKIS